MTSNWHLTCFLTLKMSHKLLCQQSPTFWFEESGSKRSFDFLNSLCKSSSSRKGFPNLAIKLFIPKTEKEKFSHLWTCPFFSFNFLGRKAALSCLMVKTISDSRTLNFHLEELNYHFTLNLFILRRKPWDYKDFLCHSIFGFGSYSDWTRLPPLFLRTSKQLSL